MGMISKLMEFYAQQLKDCLELREKSDIAVECIVGHFTQISIFNALNLVKITKPSSEHFGYTELISSSD